ncbi:MAG: ribonuclease III [Brevinematia bacterium]
MSLSFLKNLIKRKKVKKLTDRESKLLKLSKELNLKIQNLDLLNEALTHTSFLEKGNNGVSSYERLEFLGDSVLNMCVSFILYDLCPSYKEGSLSALRASVVDEKSLSQIALRLNLLDYVNLGRGESLSDMRAREKVSADVLESIIGAIFVENGFEKAFDFVKSIMTDEINKRIKAGPKDFKSQLQKIVVAKYKEYPHYEVISETGPEHNKIFEVSVSVNKKELFATAKGRTKKEAEQKAAEKILLMLKSEKVKK